MEGYKVYDFVEEKVEILKLIGSEGALRVVKVIPMADNKIITVYYKNGVTFGVRS